MKKINRKLLILIGIIFALFLTLGGCAAAASPQGWSGCANGTTNIYCGTMDGKLISINPTARSDERNFPAKDSGEWYVSFTATPAAGLCGSSGPVSVPIYTTPLFTPEFVYIASYGGVIYAIPSANITSETVANNAALYTYPRLGGTNLGPIVGGLLLVDNSIYVADANGNVYSFNKANLSQNWLVATHDKIWTTPVYANGNIYVGTFNGYIYAMTADGGKKVWEVQLPGKSAIASSPAIYNDKVIVGSFDQYLYALNQSDGSVAWKFKGNSWFWAQPVVNNNIVYAACMDGNIYAINGDTGSEIWHYNVGGPIASKPVIVDNNIVVATDEGSAGSLYVIDLKNGTLTQDKFSIGYKVFAPLDANGNIIYIHAADDYIYAYDINNRTLAFPKFKAVVQ